MNTVFDIETASLAEQDMPFLPDYFNEQVGQPPEFTSRFTADIEARERDIAEKTRAWKREQEQKIIRRRVEFFDSAALSPDFGRIIGVGVGHSAPESDSKYSIVLAEDHSEKKMIKWLLKTLATALEKNDRIATFNGIGFDYPFLYWRAVVNSVDHPLIEAAGIKFSGKWGLQLPGNVFDLMKIAQCRPMRGERGSIRYDSMDQVCKALGLGQKLGNGKDFAGLSKADKEAYLLRDTELTVALAKRLLPFF